MVSVIFDVETLFGPYKTIGRPQVEYGWFKGSKHENKLSVP